MLSVNNLIADEDGCNDVPSWPPDAPAPHKFLPGISSCCLILAQRQQLHCIHEPNDLTRCMEIS